MNLVLQIKKTLLSLGVIGAFIAYSFVLRHPDSAPVIAPPSLKNKSPASASNSTTAHYKNGIYTGRVADAYYGLVQVRATIAGGKIADVQFLQYPSDSPDSQNINQQATPFLRQEAIQTQSARVDIVTGATQTSEAFIESLTSALAKAQA